MLVCSSFFCMFRSAQFIFKAILIFLHRLRLAPRKGFSQNRKELFWFLRYDRQKERNWNENIVKSPKHSWVYSASIETKSLYINTLLIFFCFCVHMCLRYSHDFEHFSWKAPHLVERIFRRSIIELLTLSRTGCSTTLRKCLNIFF